MDVGKIVDLALKAGSLAGAITLGWRIVDAFAAYRARLALVTRRENDKMVVEVEYRSRTSHAGVEFEMEVLGDPDLLLTAYGPDANEGRPVAFDIRRAIEIVGAAERAQRKLRIVGTRTSPDGGGAFGVIAEIHPASEERRDRGMNSARLRVTVRQGGPWPVLSRTFNVTPINQPQREMP
jgi:hypothetical protein